MPDHAIPTIDSTEVQRRERPRKDCMQIGLEEGAVKREGEDFVRERSFLSQERAGMWPFVFSALSQPVY